MTRHYCTYFDSYYLLRGLTLFRSLQEHGGDFVLWVLCCDDKSWQALQRLQQPNLRAVRLDELEAFEPRLREVKGTRSHVEYLWTLSPIWPQFLFERDASIEMITYLDADLFFYCSPEPVFDEIADNSVALFSHRVPERNKHMEVNGIYNVGWLSFRRDEIGLKCLRRWAEQCLEWCYDRCEPGRYGDQKYLDEWPQIYPKVRVIEHEGAAIAPWNWTKYQFEQRGETLHSNGVPLIFFHFHGLRFINSWLYDAFYSGHLHGEMPTPLRRRIFGPYLASMIATASWARSHGCEIEFGYLPFKRYLQSYGKRILFNKLARGQLIIHRGLK